MGTRQDWHRSPRIEWTWRVILVTGAVVADRDSTEAVTELVATGQRTTATVVGMEHFRFESHEYTMEAVRYLGLGWGSDDLNFGDRLHVVIDPNNRNQALATEPQGQWVPDWRHWEFMVLLFGGLALAGTVWIAVKLLSPADKKSIGNWRN